MPQPHERLFACGGWARMGGVERGTIFVQKVGDYSI